VKLDAPYFKRGSNSVRAAAKRRYGHSIALCFPQPPNDHQGGEMNFSRIAGILKKRGRTQPDTVDDNCLV
jgi:hypothetical protein